MTNKNNMSENIVKFKTNICWYDMKTLVYLTVYQCLKAFLKHIVNGDTLGHPVMEQELADELGATYVIEDRTPRTIPNPFLGEKLYTMEVDENGEFVFSEGKVETSETITTYPMIEGMVAADIKSSLELLISEYEANEYDEMNDWYAKASKIVPFLWD